MGLLDFMFGSGQKAEETRGPADDFWYWPVGGTTAAGVNITPETALRSSAVFAAVRIVAETLGSLPFLMYERLANGSKVRAPNHPLYNVLHDQPNNWQSSMDFIEMMMGHILLRGNGYAEILNGPRGFAQELMPLNPDRMRVALLPTRRLRYTYNTPTGGTRTYDQDEIFHVHGPSSDGITGLSVIGLARQSVGLTIAAEEYGARLFGQGVRPSGVLSYPGKLGEEGVKNLKGSFAQANAGLANAHGVPVLEEGLKWEQIGLSNDDAQFLETRKFQVTDVARWFRVPPHMLGDLERATFSNIEHQALEFVVHTIRPWAVRWEKAVRRDLITNPQRFFAEFLVDGLLRGDIKSRSQAYAIGVINGWYTRNEVRKFENMNPLPGLDEPLTPLNMRQASGSPAPGQTAPRNAILEGIALEAAARVVRKEVAAVTKAAKRFAAEQEGFEEWVREFYAEHAALVAESMNMPLETANLYAAMQRDQILAGGVGVIETWDEDRPSELAGLTLAQVDDKENE